MILPRQDKTWCSPRQRAGNQQWFGLHCCDLKQFTLTFCFLNTKLSENLPQDLLSSKRFVFFNRWWFFLNTELCCSTVGDDCRPVSLWRRMKVSWHCSCGVRRSGPTFSPPSSLSFCQSFSDADVHCIPCSCSCTLPRPSHHLVPLHNGEEGSGAKASHHRSPRSTNGE